MQSLSPTLQVTWSINSADVPPVYSYANTKANPAIAHGNGYGAKNATGAFPSAVNSSSSAKQASFFTMVGRGQTSPGS